MRKDGLVCFKWDENSSHFRIFTLFSRTLRFCKNFVPVCSTIEANKIEENFDSMLPTLKDS